MISSPLLSSSLCLADAEEQYINAWSISILTIALSSLTIWPQAINQPLIILFAILCGIGSGGFFALQSSVVAQVVGLHRLERGIGWLEIAASFGFLAGPISAGSLLDAFGGPTRGAQPYRPIIVSPLGTSRRLGPGSGLGFGVRGGADTPSILLEEPLLWRGS